MNHPFRSFASGINWKAWFAMTIKLIKRKDINAAEDTPEDSTSPTQLMLKTQSWVEEFKARKANAERSLRALLNSTAA